jgi:hypothetical protein
MTATREQIVGHFLAMPDLSGNWGTSIDSSKWNVDTDTYINGIILTVDGDYYMGYLLEVVERGTSVVSYVCIVTFPYGEHDSQWYPQDAGKFFERTTAQDEIAGWGVRTVYGLWESRDDARAAARAAARATRRRSSSDS